MSEEILLTFGSDLSRVRQDLRDIASEAERTPIGLGTSGGRRGRAKNTDADFGAFWNTYPQGSMFGGVAVAALAGVHAGGGGGTSIAAAGSDIASAISSAAAQIRGAAASLGVSGMAGGVAAIPGRMLPPAAMGMAGAIGMGGGSALPLPLARAQGLLPGPMMMSGSTALGTPESPLPVHVRRVQSAGGGFGGGTVNIPNTIFPGGGGGGGLVPFGGGGAGGGGGGMAPTPPIYNPVPPGRPGGANPLTPNLSAIRGLFYSLGINEASRALGAESVAKAQSLYGSQSDALSAEMGLIGQATTGVFGSVAGLVLDLPGHIRERFGDTAGKIAAYGLLGPLGGMLKTSPTEARVSEVGTRALAAATIGQRQTMVGVDATNRTIAGGIGAFGSRRAGIENRFASEMESISSARENLPADERTRGIIEAGLGQRRAAADRLRDHEQRQVDLDAKDRMASAGFSRQVAEGTMTSGRAQRLGMVRQWARTAYGSDDNKAINAEIEAFDAQEGYRIWQREYGAGISMQSARDRFNLQPNVGAVREIYGSGVMAQADAMRSGSAKEAELIGQRTDYQLAGYGRELLNSGSASVQSGSGIQVDFGQAGSSGEKSWKVGDDMAETLKLILDLLGSKFDALISETQNL